MIQNLNNKYMLISPESIEKFLDENNNALLFLQAMESPLNEFFPNATFSLEVCDDLEWTSETKLLLNVCVTENIFFNGMLDNFNSIYAEIEPLIEGIFCPVVLFPQINGKSFDKFDNNSAFNLIARTAYFNNDYDGSIECEIQLRDIPRHQQKEEIIDYCKNHDDIFAPDIEEELHIDFNDVCEILDELEKEGMIHEMM